MKTRLSSLISVVAITALMSVAVSSPAATVTYYVNSSLSSLTLSGNAYGLAFSGQNGNPDAMKDFWGGTIIGDLTGGVLTFSGGSAITANVNTLAPFSTSPFTSTAGGDAYGPYANGFVPGYGIAVVNGAYRNLTLDITAGSVTDSAPPATVNFSFAGASRLDYGITIGGAPYPPAGGGTSSLVGVGGLDTSVSLVTLPATVNYGVLILPVTLHTIGSNRSEDWTGTLVAVIPEPSSLALVGVGLVGLVSLQLRRSRKSL
jgi:hypothetical protein